MTDWMWITLGYGIAYGAIAAYVTSLRLRRRARERELA